MNLTAEKPNRERGNGPLRVALRLVLAFSLGVLLAACENNSMEDLRIYVEDVLRQPPRPIEPIEDPPPYVIYAYQSAVGTDPFLPLFQNEPERPDCTRDDNCESGIKPDLNRNREELEAVPLDSLRIQGTLEISGSMWGIVRSPDNIIHRVLVGHYMGRNHGKIVAILEDGIELNEIIPDSQGGWKEREASIALSE